MSENGSNCPRCGAELPCGPKAGPCPRCAAQFLQATQTEALGEPTGPRLRFTPPQPSELASLFPQLEILELVGQGGMGAVYRARQKELDRIVALKVLPPDIGQEASFAERFAREAKALARLNHPGIVTLYEFGRAGSDTGRETAQPQPLYYFLMEFVHGVNLRQVLEGGRMSPREALAIVPQICDALQYAHDQGIVHRDIKPENILLDRQGHVKVADFGLAKLVGAAEIGGAEAGALSPASTGAGTVMGTPQYMAPEQRERPTEVDHRADIYSLGVVFYQMLTGELPAAGKIEAPSRKVIVDVRLDEVVLRTLEREPERRYQQASRVKEDVETIASTSSAAQSTGAQQQPSASATAIEKSRRRLQVPAIGLIISGVINLLLPIAVTLAAVSHGGPIAMVVPAMLMAAAGGVVIVGASCMLRFQAYGLAVTASILAMGTPPGFLLGVPFGIWALMVQTRKEVREAFTTAGPAPSGAAPPRRIRKDQDPEASLLRQLVCQAVRRKPTLVVVIVSTLLLALAFGGLVLATDYARRKSQSRARTSAATQGPTGEIHNVRDFTARFSNGATIELAGISYHPSKDQLWWRPDGTPIGTNAFLTQGSHSATNEEQQAREFVLRVQDLPEDASSLVWKLEPAASWAGGQVTQADGRPAPGLDMFSVSLPRSLRQVNLKIGLGTGPWETLAEAEPGYSGMKSSERQGIPYSVSFGKALEDQGRTVVTIVHTVNDMNLRLVAIDDAGKQHLTSRSESSGPGTFNHVTATFAGSPLGKLKQFQLQARPYEWAELRKVELNPGSINAPAEAVGREAERPFVVKHRPKLGQAMLEAARDFVAEHQWRMHSESGDSAEGLTTVKFVAYEISGKRVTFEDAIENADSARFTVTAEPGSELSADRIGAAVCRKVGLVADSNRGDKQEPGQQ